MILASGSLEDPTLPTPFSRSQTGQIRKMPVWSVIPALSAINHGAVRVHAALHRTSFPFESESRRLSGAEGMWHGQAIDSPSVGFLRHAGSDWGRVAHRFWDPVDTGKGPSRNLSPKVCREEDNATGRKDRGECSKLLCVCCVPDVMHFFNVDLV